MRRSIIFLLMTFCCSFLLFSQNTAVVWGDYNETSYMDTLNGKKIIFPEYFIDSIQRFGITKYYQSFPFSKISSLKSNITFECPIENAEVFANFLQIHSNSLFSNIGFEIPSTARFNYDPTDDFWNEQKQITTSNGQETIDNLWHLKIIQADSAWNITQGDPNIKIAVIDYGFDISHPDLISKVNYNDPFDYVPAHPLESLIHDANNHGTKVACTAAGKTNGGGNLASIGFNSGLILYNSHYPGTNVSWYKIAQKAHHATFSQNASVIVLCMDGVDGIPASLVNIKTAIKEILDAGTVIVRSGGNNLLSDNFANRFPFSPEVDNRIFLVSSTDHNDNHTDPTYNTSHCHYPEITICAPGYFISTGTTMIDPEDPPYDLKWHGTSAATPIVAGVCALMKSINPDLTVSEIKYIIQVTADPINDAYLYPNQLGAGRINAYKAVKAVDDCYTDPVLQNNITDNVTCSVPMRTSEIITIQDGGVLTINSTLKIAQNTFIVVMPGGKLIINNGTLTNNCLENSWGGICVNGNANQSQIGTNSKQGIVILNNATIENALCGIRVGDPKDPSNSGGIIYATNTTFLNCRNAILFTPYKNISNNIEIANRSKFLNCDFIADESYLPKSDYFHSHVDLRGVNGITFTGCRFSNSRSYPSLPNPSGYLSSGIIALNSGFTIKPKCISNLFIGEVCSQNNIEIASTFTGLDYGIVAVAGDHMNQINVFSSEFINNDYGIYISGENNPKLLNNTFTIGKDSKNIVTRPIGIYLQNSTGFRIEENHFNNNSISSLDKIGITIKNSGDDNNIVYKNFFNNNTIGQLFLGNNYNYLSTEKGLISICNENTLNIESDIKVEAIFSEKYTGIHPFQAYITNINGSYFRYSANNIFTDPEEIILQYNNEGFFINYLYQDNVTFGKPIEYFGLQTIETTLDNTCPSKINGLNIQTIQSELTNITFNYGNLKYNYNQLIDAGNTDELIQLIQDEWSEDIWGLRTELLGQSPYLSQEAISSVALDNLLPPALLLEICIANPDATKDQGFLDLLRYEIPTPLPEYMINLIIASWDERTLRTEMEEQLAAFKTYKDEYQNYKTEFLLSDTIYNYTDIINHLGTRGSYSDYLSMAEIAINQDDFVQANLYLDILEYNTEKLTSEEIDEISSFREYISIRESIFLDTTTIYNLDSTQIAALELYASSNNYRGAILARNILCFLYDLCIDDVPAPPKMLRIGSNGNNSQNSTPFIASVKVMPNPAHEYASFIWDMKSFDKSSILYIYDQNGKIIVTQPINTKQGEWVWNIKNVPNGVYVYTLKSEQLILYSGKIIVNK